MSLHEPEAVRLADRDGLYQEQAAEQMKRVAHDLQPDHRVGTAEAPRGEEA
jgi:predicted DNA-binding protein (UPF0251 family)